MDQIHQANGTLLHSELSSSCHDQRPDTNHAYCWMWLKVTNRDAIWSSDKQLYISQVCSILEILDCIIYVLWLRLASPLPGVLASGFMVWLQGLWLTSRIVSLYTSCHNVGHHHYFPAVIYLYVSNDGDPTGSQWCSKHRQRMRERPLSNLWSWMSVCAIDIVSTLSRWRISTCWIWKISLLEQYHGVFYHKN